MSRVIKIYYTLQAKGDPVSLLIVRNASLQLNLLLLINVLIWVYRAIDSYE